MLPHKHVVLDRSGFLFPTIIIYNYVKTHFLNQIPRLKYDRVLGFFRRRFPLLLGVEMS